MIFWKRVFEIECNGRGIGQIPLFLKEIMQTVGIGLAKTERKDYNSSDKRISPGEPFRIWSVVGRKLKGEGTLENLIELSAEGARLQERS